MRFRDLKHEKNRDICPGSRKSGRSAYSYSRDTVLPAVTGIPHSRRSEQTIYRPMPRDPSFRQLLSYHADCSPDHRIVFCDSRGYTWREIDEASRIAAKDLHDLGVRKGTHLGMFARNTINWIIAFFAAQKLGENNRLFSVTSLKSRIIINCIAGIVIVDMIQIFYPAAGLLGAGLLGEVTGGTEVVFVMCFAVFGSYFIIRFSELLEKVPVISKGLIWCGQHTLIILCLHRPVAYVIRDMMHLPHFISGDPLYVDRITPENLAAFLLVFAVMVPVIMAWDRIKKRSAQ